MTIPNTDPQGPHETPARRHWSVSKWGVACMAIGVLAVAMSSDVARSHGFGVKSGYVCPYGQVFLCFNGACNCYYENSEQTKANRESIRRQKALKRVTNPCRTEPCSPGGVLKSQGLLDGGGGFSNQSPASMGTPIGPAAPAHPGNPNRVR
jgi:hypothetical protein